MLIGLIKSAVVVFTVDFMLTENGKSKGFSYALDICGEKGIINVGCGTGSLSLKTGFQPGYQAAIEIANNPKVLSNIDFQPNDISMPNFTQVDVGKDNFPFSNKQFGVAFCSHVLEHITDWRHTMDEMSRVADKIVIVLPGPVSPTGWLSPVHVNHFSVGDMQEIVNCYPNTIIFY